MISVVVCTYNRADLLPGCLRSLADQAVDKGDYEVIVVNNNSTDDTQRIAEGFAASQPNFRVVVETAQGLSHARNRGWREAKGEYVAYMDDDALAEPDWLRWAVEIVASRRPDILGGPIYPFYLTEKPRWFKDQYETRKTSDAPVELRDKGFISGSNICFQRALLEAVNGFDPELGMRGTEMRFGEETAIIAQVRASRPGAVIFYHPQMRVRHLTPAWKMSVRYFVRSRYRMGTDMCRVRGYRGNLRKAVFGLTREAGWLAIMLLAMPFRPRRRYRYWQNHVVEVVAPHIQALAWYVALFRFNVSRPPACP